MGGRGVSGGWSGIAGKGGGGARSLSGGSGEGVVDPPLTVRNDELSCYKVEARRSTKSQSSE